MHINFWGTRGSIPVPGKNTVKYGGNTPCIQLCLDSNYTIIFDAGSGIRELGENILENKKLNDLKIFITHTHWDHIQGLPFFRPLYEPGYDVTIHSNVNNGMRIENIIDSQMNPNFFPVSKDVFRSKVHFSKISALSHYKVNDVLIETFLSHHSKGTLAYKVIYEDKTLVYLTDNELIYDIEEKPTPEEIMKWNEDLLQFVAGSDYLIHDATYKLKDFKPKVGWGHSNSVSAAIFGHLANVKKLILFHYDPLYTDKDVDSLIKDAKKTLKELNSSTECLPSYDGMSLNF
ncbi:MAG: MBL fold metallo-hydrolase [Ignavibacteria bacterium]|nr:MAG: MBL fold metallo-hydrolase [Ignavibacteria bacterium]